MPTVVEPNVKEEATTQPVTPASNEPELFAAEIEMESKSSNFLPVVLILALILVVGGTIVYFVKGARDVLTVPVATTAVNQILKAQGPSTIRFSTGTIVPNINEKPQDPHYKLLAKLGIVTTKPKGYSSLIVALNPAGENLFKQITGVQKITNRRQDGHLRRAVGRAQASGGEQSHHDQAASGAGGVHLEVDAQPAGPGV